jgi:hypothetical protein
MDVDGVAQQKANHEDEEKKGKDLDAFKSLNNQICEDNEEVIEKKITKTNTNKKHKMSTNGSKEKVILIVPGLYGSKLVDLETQEIIFPKNSHFIFGIKNENQLIFDGSQIGTLPFRSVEFCCGLIKQDIISELVQKIEAKFTEHELILYSYDYRIDVFENALNLEKFVKNGLGGRKPIVLCHSLGGKIMHWASLRNPQLFQGVVYVTPWIRTTHSDFLEELLLGKTFAFNCFLKKEIYETWPLMFHGPICAGEIKIDGKIYDLQNPSDLKKLFVDVDIRKLEAYVDSAKTFLDFHSEETNYKFQPKSIFLTSKNLPVKCLVGIENGNLIQNDVPGDGRICFQNQIPKFFDDSWCKIREMPHNFGHMDCFSAKNEEIILQALSDVIQNVLKF